jgi:hypothetical protein
MGKLIRQTMCGKAIINPPVPYLFNGPFFADIAYCVSLSEETILWKNMYMLTL